MVDFMISCFEAQKKENLELRTFFKCIADAKERDGKFVRLHNELFELSTVKGGLIIPGHFEPHVRILRAIVPENEVLPQLSVFPVSHIP